MDCEQLDRRLTELADQAAELRSLAETLELELMVRVAGPSAETAAPEPR